MGCTKAQLAAIFKRIKKEMLQNCKDMECCIEIMDKYIEIAEDRAETEAWRELVSLS